jgi:6-pyruvoyltetrahydropterin/6-carboxytetrahydropterin synthase
MFRVGVRDHIMIAHSLPSPTFGPAQKTHGATYVIDVVFSSPVLDGDNIVIDIAKAHDIVAEVKAELNYHNLDELPQFEGHITTTEYLARYIHQRISAQVVSFFSGDLKVVLNESHVAWASFEAPVAEPES